MSKTFKLDNVEYCIVRNPYTNGPMIARVDGLPIENRKEICRRFLRLHGWTDEMMPNKVITNTLEREINKILNGEGNIPAPRLENTLSKSGGSYQPRERSLSYRAINEKVDLTEHVSKFTKVYNYSLLTQYPKAFINSFLHPMNKLSVLVPFISNKI